MFNEVISIPVINIIILAFCIIVALVGYLRSIIDLKSLVFTLFFAIFYVALFPLYWFYSLLVLYIATSIATYYKRNQKMVAHKKGRQLKNLLSNLLPSLSFSFVYLIFPYPIIYFAFLCGVSCACADTLASEIGQMSRKNPRLITTLEEVKTGTDGGISVLGSAIGIFGAIGVSFPAFLAESMGFELFVLATIIGFIGCNIDSFVGAEVELKGKCSNETTNLIATTASTLLGIAIFLILF